jgi:hypothetical protein
MDRNSGDARRSMEVTLQPSKRLILLYSIHLRRKTKGIYRPSCGRRVAIDSSDSASISDHGTGNVLLCVLSVLLALQEHKHSLGFKAAHSLMKLAKNSSSADTTPGR